MLETIQQIGAFLAEYGPKILLALLGLIAALEGITALTPTEKDDLFVQRLGKFLRKIADAIGIPNRKQGGGTHPPLDGK